MSPQAGAIVTTGHWPPGGTVVSEFTDSARVEVCAPTCMSASSCTSRI